MQPVDLYQQAERSVKYAGLFIALSLLTLFLVEHLAGQLLHPIQYGLMGSAPSAFDSLLLLALAETSGLQRRTRRGTGVVLVARRVYRRRFQQHKAGGGSGVAFGAAYGLLYLLITSEDYALLAGAIGLFAILATVMIVTRNIDWYRTGAKS